VGRSAQTDYVRLLLGRLVLGRHHRSLLITGLRGVGKTVLLNEFDAIARSGKWVTAFKEIPGDPRDAEPFRDMIATLVRRAILDLAIERRVKDAAIRTLGVLRSFRPTAKVGDIEFGIGIEPIPGRADSGALSDDLTDLFVELGDLAKTKGTGVLFLFDEIQNLSRPDLTALIVALHRVSQKNLPVAVIAAGLPTLPALAGEAASYAERLFAFETIDRFDAVDARAVLNDPIAPEVTYDYDALDLILDESGRYPYFLQEWGQKSWDAALVSPITRADVERARPRVLEALDRGFFRVRFDRTTESEKAYLFAMAALGNGPHTTLSVARALGEDNTKTPSVYRDGLMRKGLVYSPSYGLIDFTVPRFGDYLTRTGLKAAPRTHVRGRPRGKRII
jgi:hypothetical protein